ncbi:ribose transport system ATP-binding protein [Microbacterium endophyticum]|uniref:Ribose transport system ATP-binding protein n=1 Tax=Microbacterium endophyticum TaxID=1526412 RepID=A0A7W4YNG8_9MICO|nr:sugar ABC transporter ATP-binding protein [Microbacterium endophyticum]MBB2976162.1 ribose transport system ATP-binding protein [Microbacterium endophyticum]NIK36459.1 ribose transport system ATP-binding protein [Microbacterium endophyticum]
MVAEQRVTASGEIGLRARGVSKTFGNFRALVGAELIVRRGTVHALLGGNGSGKSTLIKCLAGVYSADDGTLEIGGDVVRLPEVNPATARRLGFKFVHQDLGLFPQLSIAENIGLSRGYPTKWGTVRERNLRSGVQTLLEKFEIEADARTLVAELRPAQRAMVAIARALDDADSADSILLLDEPTAALGEHDAGELVRAIRKRADGGQTVVLVSHRFSEIAAVADDVTVFRDGRCVGSGPFAEMPLPTVVSLMTGGEGREMPRSFVTHQRGAIRLKVDSLTTGASHAVSFEASRGEILGFTGLDGAGHADIVRALFGAAVVRSGEMTLDGTPYTPSSPREAMDTGSAFVPQDRHAEASFADMSVTQNITATVLDRVWNGFGLSPRRERHIADTAIARYDVRVASSDIALGLLSGGNQQKVIVARWLQRDPKLILLLEPTQGVDVVSRRDVYEKIVAAAEAGATVLVASSDLDELLTLTHRVGVFRAGGMAAMFDTASTTRDEIANAMMAEEPVSA